ncbi:tetratricopeptide repeat protein [Streptomyces sp. ACA25]|uniref:tetratricopeptide repeat protein n=1 Tax=Streptomyces sp. ACA25 TaxID=3022596 RepID=UPI002307EA44|nr:tetratricopeptide repeat protein [Streptomyces sp. ACA25]MDB1089597.1 tetratricopeptide repeat protein [Streptomyces sp. ACA25]
MTSTSSASPGPAGRRPAGPNRVFRELRGSRSPAEFAAAVRRSAREIGERVSCDARYIGRVEAGEIRCPNYAYERVFLHMFPGRTLVDLGFAPRQTVRGRGARSPAVSTHERERRAARMPPAEDIMTTVEHHEESDVLRRAFMYGGPVAVASLGPPVARTTTASAAPARPGEPEAGAVEKAVRDIRLLDDRLGADGLYLRAGEKLRVAYELLDAGARRQSVSDRLHSGAGELALSVGWLAHDSGRYQDARSHYAEALATARMGRDAALEAHAFCNTSFLARDAGRPREAVRAAQAGQQAARQVPSHRLRALLALREAGGWAGLGDRGGCEAALARAEALYARGASTDDPEWMSFFGDAELAGLESQCWSALGDWSRAAACAREAVALQSPHFVRNTALFAAELAGDLTHLGEPEEAAEVGLRALGLLEQVRSTRITAMLASTAHGLRACRAHPVVAAFRARQRTVRQFRQQPLD